MRLLRGKVVCRAGKDVGRLEDVIVSRDGSVADFVVANGNGRVTVRAADAVVLS